MKKRIAFVLAGVLVCVGAVIWLIPYAPMPDMDGFWNVRIWRVNGADMTELTEQVDQTALREVLTQVQAKRVPRSQSSRPSLISVNLILCTTATAGCMI